MDNSRATKGVDVAKLCPPSDARIAGAKATMVRRIVLAAIFVVIEIALWPLTLTYTHGGRNDGPVMIGGAGGTPLSFLLAAGILLDLGPAIICSALAVVATADFNEARRARNRRR